MNWYLPRNAPPPPIARGFPCDSQAAIRSSTPRTEAVARMWLRTRADPLAQLPSRLQELAVRPLRLLRAEVADKLRLTAPLALGDQAVQSVAKPYVALHESLVLFLFVCICRFIDRYSPDGLMSVSHSASSRSWALGAARLHGRNRNCWCRCCDADADYGNQGGLQRSSSCRWSVVGLSPSRSVRQSGTSFVRQSDGHPARSAVRYRARLPKGVAASFPFEAPRAGKHESFALSAGGVGVAGT